MDHGGVLGGHHLADCVHYPKILESHHYREVHWFGHHICKLVWKPVGTDSLNASFPQEVVVRVLFIISWFVGAIFFAVQSSHWTQLKKKNNVPFTNILSSVAATSVSLVQLIKSGFTLNKQCYPLLQYQVFVFVLFF